MSLFKVISVIFLVSVVSPKMGESQPSPVFKTAEKGDPALPPARSWPWYPTKITLRPDVERSVSQTKRVIIENRVGRGLAITCSVISSSWDLVDQKSEGLEKNAELMLEIKEDKETERFPWVKCVAIWHPYSAGFVAFNAKNAPLGNNRIAIKGHHEVVLLKDNKEILLEEFKMSQGGLYSV